MRVGALCAGYGGLELGLQHAGIDTDLVWVSETNKYASTVLDARFGVPNLGDLTEITHPPQVDAITAGFPCQPVSHAGKRAGVDDERWLIRDVVDVARRAGAQWIFLENVRGVLTANQGDAFGQVLDALAQGGFDAEWACIRADQSVGACHRRERWFCVADADGEGIQGHGKEHRLSEDSGSLRFDWGDYGATIQRWERVIGRAAPAPVTNDKLSSRFVEWMMGLPDGWVTGVGLPWAQELKMLGNGVVPQQAAAAYGWLLGIRGDENP
jgi:DNA (cytosine-5)-methyltransferase 1